MNDLHDSGAVCITRYARQLTSVHFKLLHCASQHWQGVKAHAVDVRE
jgi:hypothetical protein